MNAGWFPLVADIAYDPGRIAGYNGVRGNVTSYDRTRSNQRGLSDAHGQNYCSATDRRAKFDHCSRKSPIVRYSLPPVIGCTGPKVVREHHPVTYEDLIGNIHTFTNKAMRLNLAESTDTGSTLYFDEGTNKSIVADRTTIEIHEFTEGYTSPLPKANVGSNWQMALRCSKCLRAHPKMCQVRQSIKFQGAK